jgi:hypothetical protein
MDQSQLALQRIFYSGEYVPMDPVEIFVEHELKDGQGNVIRKVDAQKLQKIAQDAASRFAQSGTLARFGPGHTFDDVYELGPDNQPRLVRKFPETEQPPTWGFFHPEWQLQQKADGKYALYAVPYVKARIDYVDNGQPRTIDGRQAFAEFPERSPEYYHKLDRLHYIALLRRAPKLDMGLTTYAAAEPDKAFYAMGARGQSTLAAVVDEFDQITRYAIGVDAMAVTPTHEVRVQGGVWRYEPDPDPIVPPADTGTVGPAASTPPAGAAPGDPGGVPPAIPEGEHAEAHRYTADRYAQHSLGMHASRAKHLMKTMYDMHGQHHGMTGAMHEPHMPQATPPEHNAMATPSPTGNMPPGGQKAPAQHMPPPLPPHLSGHVPAKMQAVAQPGDSPERYALMAEINQLKQALAVEQQARLRTEQGAREQYRHTRMQDLFDNGLLGDQVEHIKYSLALSDQQFEQHAAILASSIAARPPIGGPRVFEPYAMTGPAAAGAPQRAAPRDAAPDPRRMDPVDQEVWLQKRLDYMNKCGLSGQGAFEEACERYEKEVLQKGKNGAARAG